MNDINQFAQQVKDNLGLERFELDLDRRGNIELVNIEVPRDSRQQGAGTAALKALTDYADRSGALIWLSVADRDSKTGTTSRGRLVKFYRQFGFVPNKGNNKRFELSMYAGMYRDPKGIKEAINDIRKRAGLNITESKSSIKDITPGVIERIKKIVKVVHDGEGCDVNDPNQVGFCPMVSAILEEKFGWVNTGGIYLSESLEPIGDHVWNVLGDGTIVDATSLQFHEGHHIKIIPPNNPEHKRYRTEWNSDYNPGMSKDYPELEGVKWSGEHDFDAITRLRKERGDKWWLKKNNAKGINEDPDILEEINDIRRRAGLLG